ncbi:TonB-dependent receptor [Edaphobacter aggregans]|uniref:TonB-dependent receptor n=1 Tax=Edaphobacter aggregans TaxID=570835 RepID=UPI000691425E|nr:carboxypeptidase regulatory-like domain-containing protein [Edaphobacter aggregans]
MTTSTHLVLGPRRHRSAPVWLTLLLLFFCIVAATPCRTHAQTSKGILAGVIRDASGAVLPNATIVITNEDTAETRTVSSSEAGAYRAEAINPGNYRIHVTQPGFSPVDVQHIRVLPSVVTTYDATLTVGEATASITVEAQSNAINTENGQLSGTISKQELNQVPIFSLNPADLTSEMPGVTRQYATVQNLGGIGGNGAVKLTVNGARPRANNFMIDSQDINDVALGGEAIQPILPDFFSNVTVLLNDSSAEYGRAGGAVINQITQHGTNRFHGSVHEIYTGSGLDSIDGQSRRAKPIPPGETVPKARYNTHQYGFTIGGPILKDKLFAFGGGTWQRYYGGTQPSNPVEFPDAAGFNNLKNLAAAGNAQANLYLSYLDNGSYLDTNLFTPISGQVESLSVSSMPGCTGGCAITTGTFLRKSVPQLNPDTQWMYRVDFTLSSRDTFMVRYIHDRNSLSPYFPLNETTLPGFDAQNFGVSELGGGTWTHVFTPNLLNEFRASETRINAQFAGTPETVANPLSQLYNIIFNGTGLGGSGTGSPLAFGVSQNMPQGRIEELYQFQDTVGYTRGRHSFRIGADVGRLIEIDLIAQNALGRLTYTAGGGLNSMDNFLKNQLGTSGTATKTFGPTRADPHIWKIAAFAQDDVKLSPDFTLNLGLRYDYLTNPLNSLTYPAIDINNPYGPINAYIKVNEDTNNIAPRIGFAWVPRMGFLADGKTVVHGGIGIFYDPFFTNILVNSAQASPVAPSGNLTSTAPGGLPNSSNLIGSITPNLTPASAVTSAVNTLVNPLTYQYNFGVERALPYQIKGAVNYVASRGQKLYTARQLNYFVGASRIDPSRGVINVRDNRGDSQYHSLQLQLDRAFSRGLFFRFAYTYGKLLDDTSEVYTTFASPTQYSANLAGNGLGQDWGASAFDRRNIVVITYSYKPTGLRSDNTFANILLGAFTRNFTISGQTQLYSGLYTSYNTSGFDINGDGSTTNDRPVLSNKSAPANTVGIDGSYLRAQGGITNVYYDQATYNSSRTLRPVNAGDVHFLVPNATNGAAMLRQEIGRNSYANAGQQYWNVALEKAIPTPFTHLEGSALLFRGEAQQLGNHNNVTYFTNNVTQVGLPGYQNVSNAREANFQHFRLWAKFQF